GDRPGRRQRHAHPGHERRERVRQRALKRSAPRADHSTVTVYSYNAINASGLELDGTIQASDLAAALEQLRQRGLLAQKIDEVRGASNTDASASRGVFKSVKSKSLQIFSR